MTADLYDQIPGADHPLLSGPELVSLARAAKAGDLDARDALAAHNVRLVVGIARRYAGQGLDLLDLVQEGQIGLLRGIALYDPDRGYAFSTYVTYWVRQAITRAIAEKGRTVRLPVHLNERLTQLRMASQRLALALGAPPSDAELAADLGWTVQQVQRRRSADQVSRCASLDRTLGAEEEGETFGSLIGHAPDYDEGLIDGERRALLAALLAQLPDRLRQVLALRFGLDGYGEPRTLEAVGRELGITRERARQLEAQALKTLRALATRHDAGLAA